MCALYSETPGGYQVGTGVEKSLDGRTSAYATAEAFMSSLQYPAFTTHYQK